MKKLSLGAVAALCTFSSAMGYCASTFQNTCTGIAYFVTRHGEPAINATCLDETRVPRATQIVLTGIGNRNGNLAFESNGRSTFLNTCTDVRVEISGGGVFLKARCETARRTVVATRMELDGIENRDGELTY